MRSNTLSSAVIKGKNSVTFAQDGDSELWL
jgi:hypothetical protein